MLSAQRMALVNVADGLEAEQVDHWRTVLEDNGIEATIDAGAVLVDETQAEAARALFADPFAEEGDADGPEEPALEVPVLAAGERTELLARTPDFAAAQRLASILHAAGIYAAVSNAALSNVFGADGLPDSIITIASSQRDAAFAELEAVAREQLDAFAGAQNIDPAEVLEALLLAPAGLVRVAPKR